MITITIRTSAPKIPAIIPTLSLPVLVVGSSPEKYQEIYKALAKRRWKQRTFSFGNTNLRTELSILAQHFSFLGYFGKNSVSILTG